MKLKEILGGLFVMITEEEEDLITKYFSEGDYVNESQLSGSCLLYTSPSPRD